MSALPLQAKAITRILMIDDDPDDVVIIRDMLRDASEPTFPYQFESAATLAEGLQKLLSGNFNFLLLDLSLPDSSGLETFSEVNRIHPELPIVLLTGLNDQNAALEALSLGAQDYLVKGSFNASAFKRIIRYSIERSHLLAKIEQSSEERFKNLIEKDSDGMMVIDAGGIVLFANPAALHILQLAEEEVLNKPFHYPFRPGALNEIERRSPDGAVHTIEMRITEIEWEKKPAFLASIHDITETREVERLKAEIVEREKLDQLKDNFISIVSHEIKTPLTIIKAALSNLEAGVNGALSEKQGEVLGTTLRNVERLNRILRDILDLSRLESGRAVVNVDKVDLRKLLNELCEGYGNEAKSKGIQLNLQLDPALPVFDSDPDMILQVLNNLLNNAMRYAKSRIDVRAQYLPQLEDACIEVVIGDDGEGIPADKMHLLFSKFEQINRPMGGSGYKGTGLGLCISKQIIDHLHGKIWANCEGPGKTKFHFTLPLRFADQGS